MLKRNTLAPFTSNPIMATKIAELNSIPTGFQNRSTLSQAINRANPNNKMAPVKPASELIFPVPKLNAGLAAFRRAYEYAKAAIPNAAVCEAICKPSAKRAMEPNIMPQMISTTMVVAVRAITHLVRRSPS